MNRVSAGRFFLYLIGIVAVFGGIQLAKGGLYVDRHEGDALHLIEIVLRMGEGQWPHLDFVTPLGIAGFLPIAAFVKAGFGVGQSFLMAQMAVAAAMIWPVYHVARTRMSPGLDLGFAAAVLIMVLALVHGETGDNVSISMHYNRWAWALAFLAVPVAIFGARQGGLAVGDGVILGLAMSFFILGKVTFAVAFAPGLILALVMRKAFRTMGVGIAVVALMMLIPTVLAGPAFWQAYIGDILQVTGSGIRPRPGVDWETLLLAPRFVAGNLVLLAAIWVLRKGERPELGVALIAFAPAFLYVTYQNYGNDPKWLALLAVLLLLAGSDLKTRMLALVACALIAPSFVNMVVSPWRHFTENEDRYIAALDTAPHGDFYTPSNRVNRVQERRTITFADPQFTALNEVADEEPDVVFQGVTYPSCQQQLGLLGIMRETAADLRAFGLGDEAKIFTADTFGGVWMFGDFEPLRGAAPWYYGELSGFENADYLLVPTCPVTPRTFKAITEDLAAVEGLQLKELRSTELYRLYKVSQ